MINYSKEKNVIIEVEHGNYIIVHCNKKQSPSYYVQNTNVTTFNKD